MGDLPSDIKVAGHEIESDRDEHPPVPNCGDSNRDECLAISTGPDIDTGRMSSNSTDYVYFYVVPRTASCPDLQVVSTDSLTATDKRTGYATSSNTSESSGLGLLYESLNDLKLDPQSNAPTVVQSKLTEDMSYGISTDSADVKRLISKGPKEMLCSEAGLRALALRRKKPAKFHCEFKNCNASFTRNADLKSHYKSHLGVTDLECPFCGTRTATSLDRHKKRCKQNPDREITSTSRKPRKKRSAPTPGVANPEETLVPGTPVFSI